MNKISIIAILSIVALTTQAIPCSAELFGDLNGDCRVDLDDLAIFAAEWLAGPESPANLNGISSNGIGVDLADFVILDNVWMKSGIAPFTDDFAGPSLDPAWTVVGKPLRDDIHVRQLIRARIGIASSPAVDLPLGVPGRASQIAESRRFVVDLM